MIVIITSIFFFDRFFKYHYYNSGNHIINKGVAFGLFDTYSELLIILQIFVTFVIIFIIVRKKHKNLFIPLLMIFTGSVSNLVDRIMYNGVLDYIDIGWIPVFNLADVMVVLGSIYIFYKELFKHVENNQSRRY